MFLRNNKPREIIILRHIKCVCGGGGAAAVCELIKVIVEITSTYLYLYWHRSSPSLRNR